MPWPWRGLDHETKFGVLPGGGQQGQQLPQPLPANTPHPLCWADLACVLGFPSGFADLCSSALRAHVVLVLAALGSASCFLWGRPPASPGFLLWEADPPAVLPTSDRPQAGPPEAEEVAWGPVVRTGRSLPLVLVEDLGSAVLPMVGRGGGRLVSQGWLHCKQTLVIRVSSKEESGLHTKCWVCTVRAALGRRGLEQVCSHNKAKKSNAPSFSSSPKPSDCTARHFPSQWMLSATTWCWRTIISISTEDTEVQGGEAKADDPQQGSSTRWNGTSVCQSLSYVCNPMDCSPPGFSDNGILQARIPEWAAISFSRRSSWPSSPFHANSTVQVSSDLLCVASCTGLRVDQWGSSQTFSSNNPWYPISGSHFEPVFHLLVVWWITCRSFGQYWFIGLCRSSKYDKFHHTIFFESHV